ncbi:hypothetical protein [Nocardia sp. NPDC019395]|uniref:hypothetical protein n=1 Tax=Nocardia sp. NPDC019395 TaxID=3154686 RepID=UPI0033DE0E99
MEIFEQRYRWYLEMLRDEPALGIRELETVERQIRRVNHDFEHADIDPDHRLKLIKLRNETMTKLTAAQHHARIDDARAVDDQQRRDRRLRQVRLDQERRRDQGRGRDR